MTRKIVERRILLGPDSGVRETCVEGGQPFISGMPPLMMKAYRELGGYQALEKSLKLRPEEVIATVQDAGLIGRGGAGFSAGAKWSLARKAAGDQKYFICNAEEGEPGTFKDRVLIERNPHQILEGLIIGAYAIGASKGYIFVDAEFQNTIAIVKRAIAEAEEMGFLGARIRGSPFSFHLNLFLSMGAYICGEETALMNSIEGKRPVPRIKPPYPTDCGLFEKPTVVNNVETLANIPPILFNGSEWYCRLGVEGSHGTKLFSVSGNVNRPGVYEIELGRVTLGDFINALAGGIAGQKRVKAILPGGASTSFLTEEHLDVLLDYQSIREAGSSLGTGGMLVFDEDQSIPMIVKHIFDFYRHESCGFCVPCRLGTNMVHKILGILTEPIARSQVGNFGDDHCPEGRCYLDQLEEIGRTMKVLSRCGLGQSACDPLLSALAHFEQEFLSLLENRQREYEPFDDWFAQIAL
jgi:NADH-quinone oxidoreductase subunit F